MSTGRQQFRIINLSGFQLKGVPGIFVFIF